CASGIDSQRLGGRGEPGTAVLLGYRAVGDRDREGVMGTSSHQVKLLSRALLVLVAALVATLSLAWSLRAAAPPATTIALKLPTAGVPLPGGGFLVADSGNNLIRRIDAAGAITTVAGTGTDCANTYCPEPDTIGDGGPATQAQLDDPTDAVPT